MIYKFKIWYNRTNSLIRFVFICILQLKSQGRGEILISLCYQPAANRLTVVVLKARNLPKMDITGLSGKKQPSKIQTSKIKGLSNKLLLSNMQNKSDSLTVTNRTKYTKNYRALK